ncbi:MAG: hypothetical protein AAF843_13020 [Bacteroidota bacterium]
MKSEPATYFWDNLVKEQKTKRLLQMVLVNNSCLSVRPVKKKEFDIIVELAKK